jgi:nitronate monooxygenase
MILDSCDIPIVGAPLAGGPSTPELAAAVSNAGGLGFLAAGYLSEAELAQRRHRTGELTGRPFGVNLFCPGPAGDAGRVREYASEIEKDVRDVGAALGAPRHDDDHWDAKVGYLLAHPVPVVSFTFGIPQPEVIAGLRAAGSEAWVTVTTLEEAHRASAAGADLLLAQGYEAGGHRGGVSDAAHDAVGLIALVQLITARVPTPVVAAGGIATGAAIAAVLCLGARAAALGTAFLDCPEAGTAAVYRASLHNASSGGGAPTRLTRAFSGRTARGIENGFLLAHTEGAPAAYPEVHHLTSPMRKAAREAGLADYVNLWAGQAYPLTGTRPAGDVVRELWAQAQAALGHLARSMHGAGQAGPPAGARLAGARPGLRHDGQGLGRLVGDDGGDPGISGEPADVSVLVHGPQQARQPGGRGAAHHAEPGEPEMRR